MSGFILSTGEPTKSFGIKTEYTPIIVLSDWLIYLFVLLMIGGLKMNERLNDMTSNRLMLMYHQRIKKIKKIQQTSNFIQE